MLSLKLSLNVVTKIADHTQLCLSDPAGLGGVAQFLEGQDEDQLVEAGTSRWLRLT